MDYEFDESKFNEEDEQMLVVRGANKAIKQLTKAKSMAMKPTVKEFSLCERKFNIELQFLVQA